MVPLDHISSSFETTNSKKNFSYIMEKGTSKKKKRMLDLQLTIYILVSYFVSVIGGFIPFFIKLLPNAKLAGRILDVCSASAGGLFLSGGLIHMLAEGNEMIDDSGYSFHGLPLGYFICGISFLLIFFFDRVVATHGEHASFAEQSTSEFVNVIYKCNLN